MNTSRVILWIGFFFFLLSTLLLFSVLNIETDIDGFYLLGGSNNECGMGVTGTFKPMFLVLLAITDVTLLIASIFLILSQKLNYLWTASLINICLFLLNNFWKQPRLFTGYELTSDTNMLDALTGKCFLFYSPHDGSLLLTILFSMAAIIISQQVIRRRTR